MNLKFGCLPRKPGTNAPLLLAKYMKTMPVPPTKVFREYGVLRKTVWNMFGNDTVGDCTCAMIAHMLMLFTAHTGNIVVPEKDEVLSVYSAISGYIPGNDATDVGATLADVFDFWMNNGLAGHKILAWADVDPTNLDEARQAIYMFGATGDAVNLPNSAMDQFNAKQAFSVVANDGGIAGGHAIPRTGYGREGFNFETWGADQKADNDWCKKYLVESVVVITEDWINQATAMSPSGFDLATLQADLRALKIVP